MERLLSVLGGEVKRIERNGIFYAAALKNLTRNFGIPQLVLEIEVFNVKQIYIFLKFQQTISQV